MVSRPPLPLPEPDAEQAVRTLVRRVDALLGTADYQDSPGVERLRGVLGLHDEPAGSCRCYDSTPQAGDVVGVSRIWYDHYGIAAADGRVIHFCGENGENGDIGGTVQETDFAAFLQGSDRWFVLSFADCPDAGGPLFSREDSLARARAQIGAVAYHLTDYNCEHFALWCRTGQARSQQVDAVRRGLQTLRKVLR